MRKYIAGLLILFLLLSGCQSSSINPEFRAETDALLAEVHPHITFGELTDLLGSPKVNVPDYTSINYPYHAYWELPDGRKLAVTFETADVLQFTEDLNSGAYILPNEEIPTEQTEEFQAWLAGEFVSIRGGADFFGYEGRWYTPNERAKIIEWTRHLTATAAHLYPESGVANDGWLFRDQYAAEIRLVDISYPDELAIVRELAVSKDEEQLNHYLSAHVGFRNQQDLTDFLALVDSLPILHYPDSELRRFKLESFTNLILETENAVLSYVSKTAGDGRLLVHCHLFATDPLQDLPQAATVLPQPLIFADGHGTVYAELHRVYPEKYGETYFWWIQVDGAVIHVMYAPKTHEDITTEDFFQNLVLTSLPK